MTSQIDDQEAVSTAYDLFILVLTVLSLVIMVALVMPRVDQATRDLLLLYDNLIALVFLADFAMRMRRAPSKTGYFIGGRGWLDLLGSIPTFGISKYASLLRLARVSRLLRITRLKRMRNKRDLVRDVVENRSRYAVFVTLILAILVITISSAFVLNFESGASDATITSGGTALWWSIVILTTVGYGDTHPVTTGGRITGAFVMIAGVGVIASLASILASVLIPPPKDPSPQEPSGGTDAVAEQLAQMREELASIRSILGRDPDDPART